MYSNILLLYFMLRFVRLLKKIKNRKVYIPKLCKYSMVKINRTYSIDSNIVEKLKDEGNVSELINNLLEGYFNRANSKDLQHLKKELDLLENEIDGQRRERDRKADIIREIENKAADDSELLAEEKIEADKNRVIQKNIMDLVKAKELDFENYRKFKNSPDFEKAKTDLYNKEITLEEYKNIEAEFLESYFKKLEEEQVVKDDRS